MYISRNRISNKSALKIETKFLGCPKNFLDSISIEFKMIPPFFSLIRKKEGNFRKDAHFDNFT